jgi:hypothetical protein
MRTHDVMNLRAAWIRAVQRHLGPDCTWRAESGSGKEFVALLEREKGLYDFAHANSIQARQAGTPGLLFCACVKDRLGLPQVSDTFTNMQAAQTMRLLRFNSKRQHVFLKSEE